MKKRDDFTGADGQKPLRTRHTGRWLSLAAILVLAVGAAAFLPGLLRGPEPDPEPVPPTSADTPRAPDGVIPEVELAALLAAEFPDPEAGDLWTLRYSAPGDGCTLGVLEYHASAHVGGLKNLLLGLFNNAHRAPIGPVRQFRGDAPGFHAWSEVSDGQLRLLCTNVSTYQGVESPSAALFAFDGTMLSQAVSLTVYAQDVLAALPEGAETMFEDDTAFWDGHKGIVSGPGMHLYRRSPDWDPARDGEGGQWLYECYLPLGEDKFSDPRPTAEPHYYIQPALPLTTAPGGVGNTLAVDRRLTYDFARGYYDDYSVAPPYPLVTDRYAIRNDSKQEQHEVFFYPWVGGLTGNLTPKVTVDGAPIGPDRVLPGTSASAYLGRASSSEPLTDWFDFDALFTGGGYLSASLTPPQRYLREAPVKVYRVEDLQGQTQEVKDTWAATLAVELIADPDVQIFTYGFDGCARDDDNRWRRYSYSVNAYGEDDPHYLILVGGEPESWSTAGYRDGACDPAALIPGLSAELALQSGLSSLDAVLAQVAERSLHSYVEDAPLYTAELLYRTLSDRVWNHARSPAMAAAHGVSPRMDNPVYGWDSLEGLLGAACQQNVFFYQCGVTVPAGGEVVVESAFYLPPATNLDLETPYTSPDAVYYWDFATILGSPLDFRSLQVEYVPGDGLRLLESDLGLDPAAGGQTVSPSPAARGWLTVGMDP